MRKGLTENGMENGKNGRKKGEYSCPSTSLPVVRLNRNVDACANIQLCAADEYLYVDNQILINGNLKILLSENYITCCLIFVPPYTVLFTLCTTSQ